MSAVGDKNEKGKKLEIVNVEVSGETHAIKTFVAESNQLLRSPVGSLIESGPLADVGERADPFEPEAFGIEGLAESQVHVVGAARGGTTRDHVVGKTNAAFVAAQYRHGIAGIAIHAMASQFNADLIVSISKVVRTARSVEVIDLVEPAVVRQEQHAFFRYQ